MSRLLKILLFASISASAAAEPEPAGIQRVVAVENVCAWPNLTLMPDGSITAILHNQPAHGGMEGDVDCWGSADGLKWEKRGSATKHDPNTIRMNHAAGLAKNGDLLVLCSGWTNEKQPQRPKQPEFRDAVLRSWVSRSKDCGKTWTENKEFVAAEAPWTEYIPFGDIVLADDGSLRVSCYQGKITDPTKSYKTSGWKSSNLRSDDDGATWKLVSIIGPTHNETTIMTLGGGKWIATARTIATELFTSTDDGKTWGEPNRVTEKNEINADLTQLKDGRLLLTYGVRVKDQWGVKAKLSSDGGKTWGESLRLARSDGTDCGYPSSVQRADGKVVTAYYSKSGPECTLYHMGVAVWDLPAKP